MSPRIARFLLVPFMLIWMPIGAGLGQLSTPWSWGPILGAVGEDFAAITWITYRAVGFDLTDDEAVATSRSYAADCAFPKDWTDAEIVQRVRDAEKSTTRGCEIEISNGRIVEVEYEDGG